MKHIYISFTASLLTLLIIPAVAQFDPTDIFITERAPWTDLRIPSTPPRPIRNVEPGLEIKTSSQSSFQVTHGMDAANQEAETCVIWTMRNGAVKTKDVYLELDGEWRQHNFPHTYRPYKPYGTGVTRRFRAPRSHWKIGIWAQLQLAKRDVLPWEAEVFRLCRYPEWLIFSIFESAYDYSIRSEDERGNKTYILTPNSAKKPMDPDQDGLTAAASYDAGQSSIKVNILDKWAQYYQGEITSVDAVLRDASGAEINSGNFKFAAAPSYELLLPQAAGSGKCSLEWTFKRLGKISKDTLMTGNPVTLDLR